MKDVRTLSLSRLGPSEPKKSSATVSPKEENNGFTEDQSGSHHEPAPVLGLCFELEGLTPAQTVERLKERGIVASTTPPYKYEYARVTPSLWNTPEDVEATLRAIR